MKHYGNKQSVGYLACTASLLAVTVFCAPLSAAEVNMIPGMWETTTTMNSDMLGSKTFTNKECMTKNQFDPKKIYEQMMQDMPEAQCDGPHAVSGDTVTIDMTCSMQGGEMSMKGEFTYTGTEGSGDMEMIINVAGMKMEVGLESSGRRVGDC